MGQNPRKPYNGQRGLPTDEEINGWCKRLQLCLAAIEAEWEYDVRTSGEEVDSTEYEEMELPYKNAIEALKKLT